LSPTDPCRDYIDTLPREVTVSPELRPSFP
jgi:hypothetical protein